MDYINFEYWNSCDLGGVYYQNGFHNILILEGDIGAPEYINEKEGAFNTDGLFVLEFQKLIKTYKIVVLVPEYVVDALMFMSMHDNIRLVTNNGLFNSEINNIEVTSSWEKGVNECFSMVEIKFNAIDPITKDNCCVNL